MVVQTMSSIRRDFVASHLRSQINRLRSILSTIEEEDADNMYASESLREIEVNLRQIRKLCVEN
jgi:hypothetical protein